MRNGNQTNRENCEINITIYVSNNTTMNVLQQYNLTVSQDTDVPYANVIGFLIPIADIKLLIKKAITGGAEAPPEEAI